MCGFGRRIDELLCPVSTSGSLFQRRDSEKHRANGVIHRCLWALPGSRANSACLSHTNTCNRVGAPPPCDPFPPDATAITGVAPSQSAWTAGITGTYVLIVSRSALRCRSPRAGKHVLAIADDTTVTVIELHTGEVLATNTVDPTKTYRRNTQKTPGRWPEAP